MDKQKVFKGYTGEIENILMLSQTVNKRGTKDLNDFGKGISNLMINKLLPLTENIGRLRGYGSGIAARNKITENDTMEVFTFISEIQSYNKDVQLNVKELLKNDEYPQNMQVLSNKLNKKVNDYLNLTKKVLLKNPEKVDSNDFFEEGTEIISLIVKIYDLNNKSLINDSKGYF